MITIPGQLAIETRHGRYGDFNVGQLRTSIGQFSVKDPELDQYPQGKYDGDFIVVEIRPQTYQTSGRIVFEMRAYLGGMTLSNIDPLTQDDARRLSPQEPDPIEQEPQKAAASAPPVMPKPAAAPEPSPTPQEISVTEAVNAATPDSAATPDNAATPGNEAGPDKAVTSVNAPTPVNPVPKADDADAQLFGPLWPLPKTGRFKLDTTIDRRSIRQQVRRLYSLDYDIDPNTQEWYRKAA